MLTLAEESLTSIVSSPFADQTRTRDALQRKIANADRELARIELAQRSLREANRQSLPPDPSVAATLYQNWLIELAHASSLTNAIVTPSQPLYEEGLGHRLSMTLQADASAPQIALCIVRFHQMPLLHRLSHATITETGGSTKGTLRVTLTCEALSLASCEPRQSLLCVEATESKIDTLPSEPSSLISNSHGITPTSNTASSIANGSSPEKTMLSDSPLSSLVELFQMSRPFQRVEPIPPKPVATKPAATKPPAPINPLGQIRFVGTWHNGNRQEAWFFDDASRREFVVAEQGSLKIESLQGRLLKISTNELSIEVSGEIHQLALGQRLSQLCRKPNSIPE